MRVLDKAIFVLIFWIAFSCNDKAELIDYVNQLPSINTPLSFDSETTGRLLNSPANNLNDSIQAFLPGYNAIGVLFKSTDYVVVLFQVPNDTASPLIMTLNLQGIKLDEWLLYNNVGHDLGVSASAKVTIKKDQTFELTENEKFTLRYNKTTNTFQEIDSSISIMKKFRISKDGKFIKIDSVFFHN